MLWLQVSCWYWRNKKRRGESWKRKKGGRKGKRDGGREGNWLWKYPAGIPQSLHINLAKVELLTYPVNPHLPSIWYLMTIVILCLLTLIFEESLNTLFFYCLSVLNQSPVPVHLFLPVSQDYHSVSLVHCLSSVSQNLSIQYFFLLSGFLLLIFPCSGQLSTCCSQWLIFFTRDKSDHFIFSSWKLAIPVVWSSKSLIRKMRSLVTRCNFFLYPSFPPFSMVLEPSTLTFSSFSERTTRFQNIVPRIPYPTSSSW